MENVDGKMALKIVSKYIWR